MGSDDEVRPPPPREKKQQSLEDYDDDEEWKKKEKQIKKQRQTFSRRLADLGVIINRHFCRVPIPIPPDMVLSKSDARRWVNPLLSDLVQEDWLIDDLQDNLNKQSFTALVMMSVIFVVIMVASICKLSYASLGVVFWYYRIYIFCTLTYLIWLWYKEKLLEKYRVSVAEWVLELKKELPADQCDDYPINRLCCVAAKPLGFTGYWMSCGVMSGFSHIVMLNLIIGTL